MMRRYLVSLLALLGAIMVLTGCVSNPPVTMNYYSLPAGETVPLTSTRPRVLTGPVELPDYLDRSQLVMRGGDGRIILLEQDRWAEPLERSTTSRLTQGLRNVLKSEGIVPYPVTAFLDYDYRLTVNMSRFEATTDDKVVLQALWGVSDSNGVLLTELRFTAYERRASGDNVTAIVAAMADMLDELAAEVAAVIREIEAAGRGT